MFKSLISTLVFIALLFTSVTTARAQSGYRMEYGGMLGVSNYLGELGGGSGAGRPFIVDLKFAKSRIGSSAYVRYKFHPMFAVKASVDYVRIVGADAASSNPGRHYRNLSFVNNIWDVESTINWLFYSSAKPSGIYRRATTYLTAYLFTGLGVFHHNPKALYQGSYIPLQPLKTEGVTYSKFGYSIPFGFGMYVAISKSRRKSHRIGIEVNWRYTNTDYLDDVSTVYKNPTELSSATAIALSNRNPELTNQPDGMNKNYGWQGVDSKGNPINKAPRGNPNNKDSYMTVSISYGIAFKSHYTRSRGRKIRTVKF